MLRFTRMTDRDFFLEAEGRTTIQASMHEGGITSDDGSTRLVGLSLNGRLESGVPYRLRARNKQEQYRWLLVGDLVVAAK